MLPPPEFEVWRVHPDAPPFAELDASRGWMDQGCRPAERVTRPAEPPAPCRLAFRLAFRLGKTASLRIHVAADERYTLHLDGQPVGWGSERGSLDAWPFDSYDLTAGPGPHCLVAIVSCQGPYGRALR